MDGGGGGRIATTGSRLLQMAPRRIRDSVSVRDANRRERAPYLVLLDARGEVRTTTWT